MFRGSGSCAEAFINPTPLLIDSYKLSSVIRAAVCQQIPHFNLKAFILLSFVYFLRPIYLKKQNCLFSAIFQAFILIFILIFRAESNILFFKNLLIILSIWYFFYILMGSIVVEIIVTIKKWGQPLQTYGALHHKKGLSAII